MLQLSSHYTLCLNVFIINACIIASQLSVGILGENDSRRAVSCHVFLLEIFTTASVW